MFAVYSCKSDKYHLEKPDVTISGVLGDKITGQEEKIKPAKQDGMPWEMSGRALCRAVIKKHQIPARVESCKVLADVTFGRYDALIMEIDHIWGFSYYGWTLVLLRLRTRFEGERPKGKSTPVTDFQARSQRDGFVHEFLYLKCGHTKEHTLGAGLATRMLPFCGRML
ncbi:MAG: hypothetical protein ACLQMO_04020 [Acidobacteriaceae bacterium]